MFLSATAIDVHSVLAEHRLGGEWFAGEPETVAIAEYLLGIERACYDMEQNDAGVAQFEDTLAWLFTRVEDFLSDLEEDLRARIVSHRQGTVYYAPIEPGKAT